MKEKIKDLDEKIKDYLSHWYYYD